MITTMNPELIVEQIKYMITEYYTQYHKKPTVLVIGEVYLHFLRADVYNKNRFIIGNFETFEGLKIIKTFKEICDVF